jgi:protein tyrosine phosphatase (PTP) superfamily phosphohydrolase (DUF442 family)
LTVAFWGGAFLLGLLTTAFASDPQERAVGEQVSATGAAKSPEKLEIPGIENGYRLSDNLYSGSDPHGLETLSALRKLGIKTIISVDGVAPDVETAKSLGIRYVHLPIGYDGVPRDQALRMVKAVKTLPGPVYVHCHHGIHRGPAAAAICGMASEGWSQERATGWMNLAGTATDYRGLYTSVRDFILPSKNELAAVDAELPELSEVADLVAMMVKVDERWDGLKAIQKAGFRPPPGQLDADPTAEALQLLELFRESSRLPESQARGDEFLREMASAEGLANVLYKSMATHAKDSSPESLKALATSFSATSKSCKSCHVRYRDN